MFVAPMWRITNQLRKPDRSDWVGLVTEIVHGSRLPNSGIKSKTDEHWLRYESIDGQFAFSTFHGGSIKIEAWLDAYRQWIAHHEYTEVNCYDQAAATEIALSLGIPHDCIHWEYHQLYGFINNVDLAGWGKCNNPYFERVMTAKTLDPKDSARYPFRNHAYLSITENPLSDEVYEAYRAKLEGADTYDKYVELAKAFENEYGEMKMVDACAGPHVGTESRAEYEKQIERIGDPSKSFSKYVKDSFTSDPSRWKEVHYSGAGMTSVSDEPLRTMLSKDRAEEFPVEFDRVLKILSDSPALSGSASTVTAMLQENFQRVVKKIAREEGWANVKWLDVRPYPQALAFDWAHPRGSMLDETKYRFNLNAKDTTRYHLSMRIAVSKSNSDDDARKELAFRLAYITIISDISSVRKLVDLSKQAGLTVLGRSRQSRIRAFARSGLGVEITGDLKEADFYDQIAESVGKELVSSI